MTELSMPLNSLVLARLHTSVIAHSYGAVSNCFEFPEPGVKRVAWQGLVTPPSLSRASRDLFDPSGRSRFEDITRIPPLTASLRGVTCNRPAGRRDAPAPVIATRPTPLRQTHESRGGDGAVKNSV